MPLVFFKTISNVQSQARPPPWSSALLRHGAMAPTDNFVVCGNNEESLFGVCESMYKPDLEPEELFEVIAQCILAGVNRDCLSGWGGVVHVISKDKLITRTLKGRMD